MSRIAVAIWFVLVTVLMLAIIADDADPVGVRSRPPLIVAAAPAGVIEFPEPVPTTTTTVPPADPVPMAASTPVADPLPVVTAPQDCDGEPWVVPVGIVWRESRCNYHVVNVGGCGGHGCLGAYQFDARHFSGWANGQAACGDLDWTIPADQHECARRLSRDGTNLAPWGG